MKRRHILLLSVFTLSFAAMVVTLHGMQNVTVSDITLAVLFGVVMLVTIWHSLRHPNASLTPQLETLGKAKYFIASWAIVGASWMAVSIVLLLFGTVEGFTIIEKAWFFPAFLALTVAIIPIVKKHVK